MHPSLDSLAYFRQLNALFTALLADRSGQDLSVRLLTLACQSFDANVTCQTRDQPPLV